jgi:hypothetical protein
VLRYLRAAFWIRPRIPGLGALPVNALAVLGFAILGFGHEGFWLLGAAMEASWLWAATQSTRFRTLIDAGTEFQPLAGGDEDQVILLARLGPESRVRLGAIEEKISRVLRLQSNSGKVAVLAEMNRDALAKLSAFALKLLAARESLLALAAATDEAALQRQIAALEHDIADDSRSDATRESKEATLRILQQRLAHLDRREQSLEEIESDIARIEAQIDLAVDQAGLHRRDLAVSAEIEFASRFLDAPLSEDFGIPPEAQQRRARKSALPEG